LSGRHDNLETDKGDYTDTTTLTGSAADATDDVHDFYHADGTFARE
jgi:hypothetical protein